MPDTLRLLGESGGDKDQFHSTHVWYQQQEVGVTPLETVLACEVNVQFVRVEMPGYPSHDIPLYKVRAGEDLEEEQSKKDDPP